MRVVITGATGLLGSRLVAALRERGDDPVPLSRRSGEVAGVPVVRWDPVAESLPAAALEGAAAIVNLAGESLGDGRWSDPRKQAILNSRVVVTGRCAEAARRGVTFLSASAVGIYGDAGDRELDETAPPGHGFLADVCRAWEAEAGTAARRARVVLLRTGLVLSRDGGALGRLLAPTRWGAGGPLGGGRQWWPWIHEADAIGLMLHALDHAELSGPLNVTAPAPARQREVARALGRVLRRPWFAPAPRPALRLLLGEAAEMVLWSQRAVPAAALRNGYAFRFTELEGALRDLFASPRPGSELAGERR